MTVSPNKIALALAVLLVSPLAFAQSIEAPQVEAPQVEIPAQVDPMVATGDQFARLDADQDGRISIDEANADESFSADFSTRDADGDGFVTDVEFRAAAKPEMPEQAIEPEEE